MYAIANGDDAALVRSGLNSNFTKCQEIDPATNIYVPSTGVVATDTAAMVAAIAALPSTGGTIRLDSGPYLFTADAVNFTKPIHLIGVGPNGSSASTGSSYLTIGSVIRCASATGAAIRVNADGCTFEKLSIQNTSSTTPTSTSAGIRVETLGKSNRIIDVAVYNFYSNIDIVNGYEWFMTRLQIFDPVQHGIRLRGVALPDGGDGIISDSNIYSGPNNLTPLAGIQWESGGGPKFIGNKINARGTAKFITGINFAVADGVGTSVVVVTGNSIENVGYGIILQCSGLLNTGAFSNIAITSNQLRADTYAIAFAPQVAGRISNAVVASNTFANLPGARFLTAINTDSLDIGTNNVPLNGVNYIDVNSTVTNLFLHDAAFTTATRPPATIMRPGSKYYDTTLGIPVWSNGTNWRNAAGTSV
jgi:hypothetical protein